MKFDMNEIPLDRCLQLEYNTGNRKKTHVAFWGNFTDLALYD